VKKWEENALEFGMSVGTDLEIWTLVDIRQRM
jgi:hypothetical protein